MFIIMTKRKLRDLREHEFTNGYNIGRVDGGLAVTNRFYAEMFGTPRTWLDKQLEAIFLKMGEVD